ncbi:hypothetical protein KBC04_00505 [Candidatus Babeliales bacterium]|nr:hypothetical protein [Candidatus Babeliales bacterium]MBP9843427.1 hypothetical protein [Candidatus Babeliales bacterium]
MNKIIAFVVLLLMVPAGLKSVSYKTKHRQQAEAAKAAQVAAKKASENRLRSKSADEASSVVEDITSLQVAIARCKVSLDNPKIDTTK